MALWGKIDQANNAPKYVVDATTGDTGIEQFGNTVFGVDTNEAIANQTSPGWIRRVEGTGGRDGRVQEEILVAGKFITSDAEDTAYPDYVILIGTQPTDATANSAADEQATFTVVASTRPTGGTLSYQWEYDDGGVGSWANVTSIEGLSGDTTDTLTADANTITDGTLFRVVVSTTGADDVTSAEAEFTVTAE